MENPNEELECRVCRSGAEPNNKLYSPCKCTGSIGLVHQECLEAWLRHAQKTNCELCGTSYKFSPQYAPDTPETLPLRVLIETSIQKLVTELFPSIFKIFAAIVIWLFFVPVATARIYRVWIRNNKHVDYVDMKTFAEEFFERAKSDVVGGIVICTLIIFACIVAVSTIFYILIEGLIHVNI